MIRILYLTPEGKIETQLASEQIPSAMHTEQGMLWIDITDEPIDSCEDILREKCGFHPLAVSDALQTIHVPKVDDWDWFIYLVLHGISLLNSEDNEISSKELDIFIGKNFIVTYEEFPLSEVEIVWKLCQQDERYLKRGSAYILYRLADELIDDYTQAIDSIEDTIENIEDAIFNDPQPETLQQIFTIKRTLLHLRRIITPQRDVLNKFARDEYTVIDAQYRVFFRDVYDHLVRLTDVNDSMRELVGEALNSYLSVVNNRLNDIMKVLTIITTLFMPLSFLTGFFGMNFFQPVVNLESWTGMTAFIIILAVMALVPISMFLWIKRQHWM
jgi:magnesium transporter